MTDSINLVILPYTAVSFSMFARFIFMYLLYTKRSTNIYSLSFCGLSILSSAIWIPYGVMKDDPPIIVRSGVEILLLSLSGLYIPCRINLRPHPSGEGVNFTKGCRRGSVRPLPEGGGVN